MKAETLARVYTHAHTDNLENKININKKIKDRDIVLVSEYDTG